MEELQKLLQKGMVIPAHPLALNKKRELDERRQKALTRYYLEAGAGGIAVGVHTTQFEIHEEKSGLLQPVLAIAAEAMREFEKRTCKKIIKIAGVCGKTPQAVREAKLARELGYDMALLSLSAFKQEDIETILTHCRQVAEEIPVFGFYLNPNIGGIYLPFEFWRKFLKIKNVLAVKIAPFDRYKTADVVRAAAETDRNVALYTGNDDTIVFDLISEYIFEKNGKKRKMRIVGGLLGHWAFGTKKAVEYFNHIRECVLEKKPVPIDVLQLASQITDANGAVFDAANRFSGCVPGINYMLVKSGLLEGPWCINPKTVLSPGQKEEIDRVWQAYPHLRDDDFIEKNIGFIRK